ncbi:hypothetical protein [Aeromicrobium sp. CF3.5]|uniref:hypothetical protein n=1 Tax=Aeromicrobium sp. CF3.5 TaxID=3373078 RepID=UPI003EE7E7DA
MVRDAVALLEDVPEESIEVELVPELDEALSLAIAAAELDREESERLARRASDAVALIARSLSSDEGYSLRDIGVILGVSHQRVAQIIGAKPAPQGGTSSSKASGRTRVTVRSVTSGRSGAMSKVARGRRSISKA